MVMLYLSKFCTRLNNIPGKAFVQLSSLRCINTTSVRLNANSLFGSLPTEPTQGEVSESKELRDLTNRLESAMDEDEDSTKKEDPRITVTPENDVQLQEYIASRQEFQKPATEILLTPLKREIYKLNCKKNNGFYKPDTIVTIPKTKQKYKLHLSKKEIEELEPSVYLQSYRIKSSMKKATVFLRMLRGLDLKKGISQCQFSKKGLGRDVGELLQRGIEDGKKLGLNENDLYISQIWVGSDGSWVKRIDFKGRGRMGIIRHRYIHIKCILKTKSVTQNRLKYESKMKEMRKKPWVQLANKPIRGVPNGVYKW